MGAESIRHEDEEEVMGDMEDEYDEEEMDQDEMGDMENDQDVKPDQSVHDASVHEEENVENFDTDIRNAGIGLDEKLTLQKGFSGW
jgi:hypothetical protein